MVAIAFLGAYAAHKSGAIELEGARLERSLTQANILEEMEQGGFETCPKRMTSSNGAGKRALRAAGTILNAPKRCRCRPLLQRYSAFRRRRSLRRRVRCIPL